MTGILSPSNRLYRGEVDDFLDAMRCVAAQCCNEMEFCDRYERDFPEAAAHERGQLRASLESFIAASEKCKSEYYARVHAAAMALAKEWQQSDDEDVRRIGEALESGDYSQLAL